MNNKPVLLWILVILLLITNAITGYYLYSYSQDLKDKKQNNLLGCTQGTKVNEAVCKGVNNKGAKELSTLNVYFDNEYDWQVKFPYNWAHMENAVNIDTTKYHSDLFMTDENLKNHENKWASVSDMEVTVYKNLKDLPNNEQNLDFNAWINQEKTDGTYTNVQEYTLDGIKGYSLVSHGMFDYYEIWVQRNDYVYTLSFSNETSPDATEQQIIDDFEFIN